MHGAPKKKNLHKKNLEKILQWKFWLNVKILYFDLFSEYVNDNWSAKSAGASTHCTRSNAFSHTYYLLGYYLHYSFHVTKTMFLI